MDETKLRNGIQKFLDATNLFGGVPSETRKSVMRRLMVSAMVFAWLPLFALVYGVIYRFLFKPFEQSDFANALLLIVILASAGVTGGFVVRFWKKFNAKMFEGTNDPL
jgi:hypothetical protein